VVLADGLDNEETYSLELGYTGKFTRNLKLRADVYYQRYDKLIGYTKTYVGTIPYHKAGNIDGADAWGSELELIIEGKRGKLSAWYAYNDFQGDVSQQGIRAYIPAQHKVGLTGRLFLPDGWTFNTNYKFTNSTRTLDLDTTILDTGSSHRLDLTAAKQFSNGHGEIMIGVSDIFNNTRGPHFALGGLTAHETPGRTFFIRLQLRF
jgi:outer membrane receptor protein involved in Fe transport